MKSCYNWLFIFVLYKWRQLPYKKIKKSITGNGNASKVQVASMLQSLFDIKSMPKHLDATDGLAAAACHYFQRNDSSSGKSYSSWSSFLKENPEKLA